MEEIDFSDLIESTFSYQGLMEFVLNTLSFNSVVRRVRMPLMTKQLRDPDINPCLSETDASSRCMAENNYNKERCSSYFLKYKNCRRFWHSIMVQRRQNGVKPFMPIAAERAEILGAMGKMPY